MSILLDSSGAFAIQTVSLSLFRFDSLSSRLWAFAQMGLARRTLRRTQGMVFHKLCGTGTGEGFTPRPNWAVYTLLATWPDRASAERGVEGGRFFRRHRRWACESCTLFLRATSSRGQWDGTAPFETVGERGNGPVAALTRATIRPRILLKFWRHVPGISATIRTDPHIRFRIGMGEVPWLHQITFSVWPDERSMAEFARKDGPHARAIRAVRDGDWFSEELYARFEVLGVTGTWEGRAPLDPRLQDAA